MKKKALLSASLILALSTSAFAVKPPGHSETSSAPMHGSSAPASAAKPAEPLSGKVLQTMDSGGYSYVYLQQKKGDKVWVAIPATQVKVGDSLTFKGGMEMRNFASKSLKRTFDSIIFADGLLNAPAATAKPANSAKAADAGKMQGPSPATSRTSTAKEGKISVTKATGPNAATVESAYGNIAKLDKKKVVIRGKVVKVSANIMGKNWIHIQDGTGSQAKGNYDLTCTLTGDLPSVGEVITISGTLAKDRDFGAGYLYKVIMENATYKK